MVPAYILARAVTIGEQTAETLDFRVLFSNIGIFLSNIGVILRDFIILLSDIRIVLGNFRIFLGELLFQFIPFRSVFLRSFSTLIPPMWWL